MRQVGAVFAMLVLMGVLAAASLARQDSGSAGGSAPQRSTGTTRSQVTGASGEKTIVGCVAEGAPSGYVLKTDEGKEVSLHTDRDLSAFVGKKVSIHAAWQRTGVTMSEPDDTAAKAGEGAAAGKATHRETEFGGDLRLRFKGKVLGDCNTSK
ncbi:MAG TPA: hypothetical protein VKZ53_21595 [Candidatus Angelobacter sp.]|nr:hypothetical protein [Candidatus Angelobacter sp.]